MITSISLLWVSAKLSKKKIRLNIGGKSIFGNSHYDFDLVPKKNQENPKQFFAFEGFCGVLNDEMKKEYSLELLGESAQYVARITYMQYQNFSPEIAEKKGDSYKPFCI